MNAPLVVLATLALGLVLWLIYWKVGRARKDSLAESGDPGRVATPEPSSSERLADENVQFTVYRPNEIDPSVWYTLLAFVHLARRPLDAAPDQADPVEVVKQQASAILGTSISNYQPLAQDAARAVPRDGELTFIPEVEGLDFDPPQRSFNWRDAVHRETFLLRAKPSVAGRLLRGRLAVFSGRILLADVPLSIRVCVAVAASARRPDAQAPTTFAMESAPRYRRIFASYSYKDSEIVEEFEHFARAMGDEYFRDVATLRSGEFWTERLKALIEGADVFQLFWSWRSIDSPSVRQEWEYALQLGRPGFIRPVYWEEPLPQRPENNLPPVALSQLHFQKLPRGLVPNRAGTNSIKPPSMEASSSAPGANAETSDLAGSLMKESHPKDDRARTVRAIPDAWADADWLHGGASAPNPASTEQAPVPGHRSATTKFIARNRTPRVNIDYEVDLYGPTKRVQLPFIIGVLADLSGRVRGPMLSIAETKFFDIDFDNFDRRLGQIRPRLCFSVPSTDSAGGPITVDITLATLADFSPAAIASKVPPLRSLIEARQYLRDMHKRSEDNDHFEDDVLAIAQDPMTVKQWAVVGTVVTRALKDPSVCNLETKQRLMSAITLLDSLLSNQLRPILHHPDFQAIEAAWRGLHHLVSNTETGETLKIRFLDISKKELANAFSRFEGPSWDQNSLFKLIYEQPYGQLGGEPFSCLIGDFYFDHSPADISLLTGLAKLAAAAHAPLIAGASPGLMRMDSWQELMNPRDVSKLFATPEYTAWHGLRESDDARYIGLTIPRFLARQPHGTSTNSVDEFAFAELSAGADPSQFTWSNSAYALAVNIARSFKSYGSPSMIRGIQSGGAVEGLPVYTFPTDSGGTDTRCPTEIAIDDRREMELAKSGLIALIHRKNTDLTAFITAPSLHKPGGYADTDTTANAKLSAQLPYVLEGCRYVQYAQGIVRDKVGSFNDAEAMSRTLNLWITRFVDSEPAKSTSADKALKPLSLARVTLETIDGIGFYSAKLFIRTQYPQSAGPLLSFAFRLPAADFGSPQLTPNRPTPPVQSLPTEEIRSLAGFPPAADVLSIAEGLVDVLEIPTATGPARIELHHGDLTRMRSEDAVDVLVLSAYPNDYHPVEGSLIRALDLKGISVAALAANKHVDLRSAFSCWLSQKVDSPDPAIRFARILCFESLYRGAGAPEAVGDIFRALAPFVAGEPRVSSIAMPVLATGSQGYSAEEVLPPLLDSAIEWLRAGLPIRKIAIYAHSSSQARQAQKLFALARQRLTPDVRTTPPKPEPQYDAFVSYAREDSIAALAIADHLKGNNLRVFVDQLELQHGAAWQQHMFEALDSSRRIVAIYSPDYVSSKVCQEEFNIAWARGRKISANVLFPVYWRSGELPTYMEMLNFLDCREQARPRLDEACQALVASLKTH
jgi:type VI secretion system protein ImpC